MERVIILKNTVTGQDLTMPVTPPSYPMEAGRAVERLDMARTGQIALPGLKTLMSEQLEVMLPAQLYPFCTAGAVADPNYYLELLTSWSAAGDICRYIVVGAGINIPVLLGPVKHQEKDGTNDVYATIPLYEYRYLDEVEVSQTQNSGRPVESGSQLTSAGSYIVVAGDSLWSISRRFYGDGSFYGKLAAANGIENPNLIVVGQVLKIPSRETISTLGLTPPEKTVTVESVASATAGARGALGFSVKMME